MSVDLRPAFELIDGLIEKSIREQGIPGVAFAASDRSRTLHVSYHGFSDTAARKPVDRDTLFQIGSISKSFTCIALLQLAEKGMVDLHRSVTEYVPWFEVRSSHGPITLHHLMTHTGGIVIGTEESQTAESEVLSLRNTEASAPPGEHYHYSNVGYKALGLVIEAVTKKPSWRVVAERVTSPLAMDETWTRIVQDIREKTAIGYVPAGDDRPRPWQGPLSPAPWMEYDTADGSISSTAEDMARYVRMLLNRGRSANGEILSDASFAWMAQKTVRPDAAQPNEWYGYGLSVFEVDGHTLIGHTGGMVGHSSEILVDLDAGIGVVVLMNSNPEQDSVGKVALQILRTTLAGGRLPGELPSEDPLTVANASEYCGKYSSPHGTMVISEDERRLKVQFRGQEGYLEPRKKDSFVALHPDLRMFLLYFGRQEGRVVDISYGPWFFAGNRFEGSLQVDHPTEWEKFVGHYRSYNPWLSNFRVLIRRGALLFILPSGEERLLAQLGPATFRVGDDPLSPERLCFDELLNDRATRAVLSGANYYRCATSSTTDV